MKKLFWAATALSLLASSLAMADPPGGPGFDRGSDHHHDGGDRRDHRDGYRRDDGEDRGGDQHWRSDRRREDHWREDHRDEGRWRGEDRWREEHRRGDDGYRREDDERYDAGAYRPPPGYYYRDWRDGDRLPSAFRAPAYVIPDAALYHLRPPPPGYYWVRVNNNAVLAGIATGVILDVLQDRIH